MVAHLNYTDTGGPTGLHFLNTMATFEASFNSGTEVSHAL